MDLDAVAEELYAASPDDFVERRSAAVARARAAKDRDLVKAIGRLRRPTRTAWLANLLAREDGDEVAGWLALGAALGAAQQRSDGPELRRLARERQLALARLTRRAAELGDRHGHQATEQSRQEVGQTLQAALADPAVAGLLRTGRLTQAASYGGFGPVLPALALVPDAAEAAAPPTGVPATGPTSAEPGSTEPSSTEPSSTEPDPAEQERERARAEQEAARSALAAADRALAEARGSAAEAGRLAAEATDRADQLAEEVEGLRSQLARAEAEERLARERARESRRAAAREQQLATDAEEDRAVREQALAALEAAHRP